MDRGAFIRVCAAIALLAAVQPVFAQPYPIRPVRLIAPFTPGGGSDTAARVVAAMWTERMSSPMVVENVPGAGGNIGAAQAARARPDGYTLLLSFLGTHVLNPSLYKELGYNPKTDLEPLVPVAFYSHVLLVNPGVPVNNAKELTEYSRSHPGKLNWGSVGIGSGGHIIGATFARRSGIEYVHVPYKGGGPLVADLMAGNVQVAIETPVTAGQFVKSGRLKALGLMSSARHPVLPEVPTLGEQGIAGFNTDGWLGLFAPKGIPAPVLASIKHTLNEIVRSDEYQKRVVQLGYAVPPPATLDDFPGFIASEFRVWTPRVEDSGAKLE